MKQIFSAALAVTVVITTSVIAQTNLFQNAEVAYTQAINGRADGIVNSLSLTDTNQLAKVHDAIVAQYRNLRDWDAGNDAKLKSKDTNVVAQILALRQKLHDEFIAKLSENLTPQQVDEVKDGMTYNVVHVTYNAYCSQYPDLTNAEKAQIMAWLIEARESAMDQGTSNAKHAVFGKFKGRINNYLSKQGYDLKTGKKKSPSEK